MVWKRRGREEYFCGNRSQIKGEKKEANSVREEKLGKLGEGGSEVGQTHWPPHGCSQIKWRVDSRHCSSCCVVLIRGVCVLEEEQWGMRISITNPWHNVWDIICTILNHLYLFQFFCLCCLPQKNLLLLTFPRMYYIIYIYIYLVERNIPNYTHHTVILIPDQLFVLSILLATWTRGP